MDRLQSELRRLYLPRGAAQAPREARGAPALVDAHASTRALVLEIDAHAGWEAVARVWRSCQAELGLPAPAIAVSGTDAFQLWFSLAEPVALADARRFLESLCARFLADVEARRLRLLPAPDPSSPGGVAHAAPVPAEGAQQGHWSAFVSPDLAPLFAETPWLDIPPGVDGQAELLCRLKSIGPAEFEAAAAHLAPAPRTLPDDAACARPAASPSGSRAGPAQSEAQDFLLRVMRDDSVALALRIEAARALLQCAQSAGAPAGPAH